MGLLTRLIVSTLVVLLTVACGGTPVEEDADVATADGTEDTVSAPDGSEPTDATGEGDPTAEEDPLEEIEWALTPAGPGSPSVNEDPIYKVLDDLDPQACAALLDPTKGWFEPSSFGTGERSVHLFLAGAHLCAGDRSSGVASYQQAQALTWDFAVEQPLHSRVCNVWDAVTRMVDPTAGPCALEELTFEDPTDPDGSGTPDATEDAEGTSEEPTGTATTSEPGTGETQDDTASGGGDEGDSP